MKQEIICEKCNGKNVKKDGVRETKNRVKVQKVLTRVIIIYILKIA